MLKMVSAGVPRLHEAGADEEAGHQREESRRGYPATSFAAREEASALISISLS
jgi:hypothetical protein